MDAKTKKTLMYVAVGVGAFLLVRHLMKKNSENKSNAIGSTSEGQCRSTESNCKNFCENSLNGTYNHPYCEDSNGNIIPFPRTRLTIRSASNM